MITDYSPADKDFYERELKPWLPPRIVDCHVHVGLRENCGPISSERMNASWHLEVGLWQSWDELRATYQTLLPEQRVSVLAFGATLPEVDCLAENAYVLSGASARSEGSCVLALTRPEWHPDIIREAMASGFLGIKPYPDLALRGTSEISIYDFVPRPHLKAVDDLAGILMLHLPRKGRIADPRNVRELLEISQNYPSIKLIVAHIGRAYCLPTAKKGLPQLAEAKGIYFDTAANLNPDVFQYALELIGPERILFGSDLPITMMRGTREHIDEQYVNYTNAPYSWNTIRKDPETEAGYTYYIYEEIKALIEAVKRAGMDAGDMEKIMFSNVARLLGLVTPLCAASDAPGRISQIV